MRSRRCCSCHALAKGRELVRAVPFRDKLAARLRRSHSSGALPGLQGAAGTRSPGPVSLRPGSRQGVSASGAAGGGGPDRDLDHGGRRRLELGNYSGAEEFPLDLDVGQSRLGAR